MRVQGALEELGLPYRVHALDHTAGDLDSEAYGRISPFRQVPVIDDDGFVVAESAAVVLYLAEKAGKLIPSDFQGRTHVAQWCVAAAATVGPTLMDLDFLEMFDHDKRAPELHEEIPKVAARWLAGLERQLESNGWIAGPEFTVADIMMAGVLRGIRRTDMLDAYPTTKAYYARCMARPA